MLLSYISFFLACGFVSAVFPREHTPAERARLLGPLAYANSRIDFPCTALTPSPTVPTSVHKLRPADIKHIGAMGDSLTAANGAKALTIIALLVEYRGVSWSIGGDGNLDSYVTLTNIIRKFNSNLGGFSTGTGNRDDEKKSGFNVAKPGAVSIDMPAQAQLLVDRMKKILGDVRYANEWKLVTFFIGGNDLCDYCKDTDRYSEKNFRKNIETALDILYDQMPRCFVNLVTVLNVAELEDLHQGLVCQNMQGFLCKCAIDKNTIDLVRYANVAYQKETTSLVDSGKYTKDDFTVVRQPFMEHMKVPSKPDGTADFSYFAPDCFHFSQKGHEAAAVELWNNMMEKVGNKTSLWNLLDTLHCPADGNGYIYTSENSK